MSIKKTIITGSSIFGFVLLTALSTFYVSLGKCPVDSLSCDGGTVCVPRKLVCNFVYDCKDLSDEGQNRCGKKYGSQAVLIANLNEGKETQKKIKAQYNFKNDSEVNEFCVFNRTLLPKNCYCNRVSLIYCARLTRLPKLISEVEQHVTILYLRNHSISLDNNDTLQSYQNLSNLILSFNNISFIPERLLPNPEKLRKLYLDSNRIEVLPESLFSNTTELVWLKLDNNKLKDFDLTTLSPMTKLRYLNLASNSLTFDKMSFPAFGDLNEIFLDFNKIKTLDDGLIENLFNLTLLSLRSNQLTFLNASTFSNHSRLVELRLSDNPIHSLESELFSLLPALNSLYLDDLRIQIDENLASKLNVSLLSIDGISSTNIDFNAIAKIKTLKYVVFYRFHYCSMAPDLRVDTCRPKTDGVSTTKDLLTNPTLRYAAWTMALLTCVGNILVLWGRFTFRDDNRTVSMVIRNLAVSDLIMGIYLLIISFHDMKFRNNYNDNAREWVASWGCILAGILSTVSSEVSILILTFMSIERFLLISDPFSRHGLNSKNVFMALYTIWLAGVSIAVLPVILFRSSHMFYGIHNGGTCFPLFILEKYPSGWAYSAFVFLGINLTLLVLIATLYTVLLFSIWQTRRATTLNLLDCEFAIRFFFIVLTDSTCWGPIIVLKFLAFTDVEVPGDAYAWLIVFVIPLNSAVNPFLYTFSTPKYRDQIYTTVNSKNFNKKHESNSHQITADDSQGKVMPLLSNSNSTNSSTSSKRAFFNIKF